MGDQTFESIKAAARNAFGFTVYALLVVALVLMLIRLLSKDHVESEPDWIRPQKKWERPRGIVERRLQWRGKMQRAIASAVEYR